MTDLLFNTPWWLLTLLMGAAIMLLWNGNRSQEPKVRKAGLICLGVAVLLAAMSYFVDTAVERAEKQSKQLAHSVEQRDWTTMRNILDPLTTVSVMNAMTLYTSRDEIVKAAQRAVDQHGVKNLRVLSSTAEKTDTLITVTMTIYSEHASMMDRPITTTWQLEWQETGKNWSLARITCIKIGNLSGEEAQRQFPKP